MKKKILSVFAVAGIAITGYAQIGINTNGGSPNPAAMLDVESNTRGFLPPRMMESERDAIQNPVAGLTIFNITSNCTNVFNGLSWYGLCGTCLPEVTIKHFSPRYPELCGFGKSLPSVVKKIFNP